MKLSTPRTRTGGHAGPPLRGRLRKTAALAALVGAASVTASCVGAGVGSGTITISVVGTNDLHGAVLPTDGRGGLALFDGFVRNLRRTRSADGGGVLLIDAGDLFQGTLESNLNEGAAVISAYNALGYTASAIGNHEFDFGPVGEASVPQHTGDDPRGALKARAAEARFPFLAANIIDDATGRPVDWPNVRASTVVDVGGVRVGIVGLATSVTLSSTMSANTQGISIAPLAPALVAESAKLRQAGASVVVATAHAGGRCTKFDDPLDLSSCADEEIFGVARALPPGTVDIIVAGHRHEGIAHEVAGVPIISSYSRGRAFGRVDLLVDRRTGRVTGRRIFLPHEICAREDPTPGSCASETAGQGAPAQYEGGLVAASPDIESILAPTVARAAALKSAPLNAEIVDTLTQSSSAETSLGNLVVDWMRSTAGTEAAILNSAGLRSDLLPGPLTYGRLYEVIPFDDIELIVTLTGAELRRIVENNLRLRGSALLVSGLRATAACAGPALVVTLTRTSGRPIADSEAITVSTIDFLVTGGDGFLTPAMPLRVVQEGPVLRNHIADWLKQHGGRWGSAGLFDGVNRRIAYPGTRPIACRAR